MGPEDAEISNHCFGAVTRQPGQLPRIAAGKKPYRSHEVELVDERALRLFDDDQYFLGRGADLWCAAGPRQAHFRSFVGTHDGGVDVGKAVELRGAQKAYIDASA